MVCFGAAVAQATRCNQSNFENLADQPIVTRAVQFVNGRLDLVVFQLNTLDLTANSQHKNIVWIEPGKMVSLLDFVFSPFFVILVKTFNFVLV